MRSNFRLVVIIGTASLITTSIYFGVVLILLPILQKPSLPWFVEAVLLPVIVLIPIGAAAWWVFKNLRRDYSPRAARAAAVVFAVFTPVSLGVAVLLSTIIGAYAEGIGGYPFFGLAGALFGIVVVTALLSLVPCALTLWITGRVETTHQSH